VLGNEGPTKGETRPPEAGVVCDSGCVGNAGRDGGDEIQGSTQRQPHRPQQPPAHPQGQAAAAPAAVPGQGGSIETRDTL